MRLVAILVAASGCFGTHQPRGHWNAARRQVCAGDVCYRVGELPGWSLLRQKHAEVAFFDHGTDSIAQANATCRDDADAASLDVLMSHLLIGYTEIHQRTQERVQLDAREALHQIADVKLDGVPRVLDLYVLKRNGCIFDLSLAAPPDRYAAAAAQFARFVAGFAEESSS